MEKYKCHICNKNHAILGDSESPLPNELSDLIENKGQFEKLGENVYLIKKETIIISGDLLLKVEETEEPIVHRIWVKVIGEAFFSKLEDLKQQKPVILNAIILSELPFFDKTYGLQCELRIHRNIYGSIHILTESQLKKDQEKPISNQRLIEMMQGVYHSPKNSNNHLTKPFNKRLLNILETANLEYLKKDKYFIIDFTKSNNVLFQLISSELLANPTLASLGIHLSNDETNENYTHVSTIMNRLTKNLDFKFITLDNIETYQKEYSWNSDELKLDIKKIILEVFEENIEEVEIEIFEP
jgi:hypothetical protein